LGVLEADAARRADQHIGHWGEPQAQLVGAHSVRRGAVGIEVELTFLDAVLHLAAGAVELFVEVAGLVFLWALLASGQITMRKVDGWQTLTEKLADKPIDLAAS
jgi:hypothetical protein